MELNRPVPQSRLEASAQGNGLTEHVREGLAVGTPALQAAGVLSGGHSPASSVGGWAAPSCVSVRVPCMRPIP